MSYTPEELVILRECKLVRANGSPVIVTLKWPLDRPPRVVPKMEVSCIRKLLDADPTHRWTRWVFQMAAGGDRARQASFKALGSLKARFTEERVNGYYNSVDKKNYHPVSKEEAEAAWLETEEDYSNVLVWSDQDAVDKVGAHGFYQNWPGGPSEIYAKVVSVVELFLKLESKILEMNAEYSRGTGEQVSLDPKSYHSADDVDKVNRRVQRFFASKKARDDLRVARVYKSDLVEVIVPLSYAAAVRYGCAKWSWAEPSQFENLLTAEHSFADPWKTAASKYVYVYIKIHGAVPSWVVRQGEEFSRCYLANLALQIPRTSLSARTLRQAVVVNEEGVSTWTLEDVRTMIKAEPHRDADPANEEWPVKRGPRVYTEEEARAVMKELDLASVAIYEFLADFDLSQITVAAMG